MFGFVLTLMYGNIAIGMERSALFRRATLKIFGNASMAAPFLDAGRRLCAALVPIAFSLACAGLFYFWSDAKYSDQHPMTSEDRNGVERKALVWLKTDALSCSLVLPNGKPPARLLGAKIGAAIVEWQPA